MDIVLKIIKQSKLRLGKNSTPMKKIALLITSCIIFSSIYSQDTPKTIRLKLYNQSSFTKQEATNTIGNIEYKKTTELTDLISPTFAVEFSNNKGRTHEIEISKLELNKKSNVNKITDSIMYVNPSDAELISTQLYIRYEYTSSRKKINPKSKGTLCLSYGAQPYFSRVKNQYYISTIYPESYTNIGLYAYLCPRYNFEFNDRFSVDLNIPIYLVEVNHNIMKIEDPTKSNEDRKSNKSAVSLLPNNYYLRFGLVYKI